MSSSTASAASAASSPACSSRRPSSGNGLRLRAIVVRQGGDQDIVKRASLLRRDSIHGQFQGTITVDEANSTIIANGNEIKVIYANDPSEVDYTAYGIRDAILIDNTGKWRDREGLSKHLRPGIDKVVLTAPGKGDVPNIVHGVNHDMIKPDEQILSCASCTTNAIVPPLKAMADEYGVLRGHVETVHSFTNDQNLLDNYHSADRRGRSAPLNMVITETGAASAVAKALPDLKAPITGSSIRVPVPDVSIAILSLRLGRETTREEVLDYLRNVSLTSPLKRQIDFTTAPDAVSSDFIGSRHASIVDSRRDQGRRRQRDPLPVVRQRVRLLLPGHPRRPARLRGGVPDLPGPGGLIAADCPIRRPGRLGGGGGAATDPDGHPGAFPPPSELVSASHRPGVRRRGRRVGELPGRDGRLLWNTRCPDAAVAQLGVEGDDIKDDDVARFSSLEKQPDFRSLRLRVPLRRARPGPALRTTPGRRRRRG